MPSKSIHVDATGKTLDFLWLSSILFIFFIHSSVDRHVASIILAIVNNASCALNSGK